MCACVGARAWCGMRVCACFSRACERVCVRACVCGFIRVCLGEGGGGGGGGNSLAQASRRRGRGPCQPAPRTRAQMRLSQSPLWQMRAKWLLPQFAHNWLFPDERNDAWPTAKLRLPSVLRSQQYALTTVVSIASISGSIASSADNACAKRQVHTHLPRQAGQGRVQACYMSQWYLVACCMRHKTLLQTMHYV